MWIQEYKNLLPESQDANVESTRLRTGLNPFLGWRAVRISLDRREILRDQLREHSAVRIVKSKYEWIERL